MKTVPLGELCNITVGRTPSRVDSGLWGVDHPWVSIADLNQGPVIDQTKERISEAGARKGRLIPPGTVLLSFKLSIGKVARAGIPLYTNEAIAALPVRDSNVLDGGYLVRALEAMDLSIGSNRAAMGATLNKSALHQVPVPLPPMEEQRRIAAILDQADAVRAKRRQTLAYYAQTEQHVFASTFGNPVERTALGDALAKAVVFTDGDWVESKDQDPSGEVRLTQLADIGVGVWLDRSHRFLTSSTASTLGCTLLRPGDVLVARMPDPLGRACVFPGDPHPSVTVVDVCIIRPDYNTLAPNWLAAALNTLDTRSQVARLASGTTRTRISRRNLATVLIPKVTPSEQWQFSKRVDALRQARDHVEVGCGADNQLFSSLQARAFCGEL